MMRSEVANGSWLTPTRVAEVTGGRLLRNGPTALRVGIDSREVAAGDCFVAVPGQRFDGHAFVAAAAQRGAAGLVVGRVPGEVPGDAFLVLVPDTREALLALAAEHRRRATAVVVGITGSCGKTTTKDMLGSVLAATLPVVWSPKSYNNEIGVPLTLFALDAQSRAAVVEIGSNGPGEVARLARVARPDIAIVTCVAESHLQGLGTLAGVAKEKAALVAALRREGLAILNGDDPNVAAMAHATIGERVFVRVDREADWFATDVRFSGFGTTFRLRGEQTVTIPRLGSHNVHNALFAIAAATRIGVPLDATLDALTRIPQTQRRLEQKRAGSVTVWDDTYNMNPGSARAALKALEGVRGRGRSVVVFGEMLELGARSAELHATLGAEVARAGVDLLVVVGEGARPIAEGATAAGTDPERILAARDPIDALEQLLPQLRSGDTVLCKASRRVQLDRFVDGLLARAPSRPELQAGGGVS